MRATLLVPAQVTIGDVRDAARGLDVKSFIDRTRPLVAYVPDQDEDSQLAQGLLEVPLEDGALADWLAPYIEANVDKRWFPIVANLRIENKLTATSLVHPIATTSATYDATIDENDLVFIRRAKKSWRQRTLRPLARTLKVAVERRPGGADMARVTGPTGSPSSDEQLQELADEVAKRIEPTIGGATFLGTESTSRALSVLGATIATICSDRSTTRWASEYKVVRFDVYRRIFRCLGLNELFEAARRIFEADHPQHIELRVPWPPGLPVKEISLGIFARRGEKLTLKRQAELEG